jgi:hypothetical protein
MEELKSLNIVKMLRFDSFLVEKSIKSSITSLKYSLFRTTDKYNVLLATMQRNEIRDHM